MRLLNSKIIQITEEQNKKPEILNIRRKESDTRRSKAIQTVSGTQSGWLLFHFYASLNRCSLCCCSSPCSIIFSLFLRCETWRRRDESGNKKILELCGAVWRNLDFLKARIFSNLMSLCVDGMKCAHSGRSLIGDEIDVSKRNAHEPSDGGFPNNN